jgi:hypothetical protein
MDGASVVDPRHFDADPDSTYHTIAGPDSDFFFDAEADPDPTFHPTLMRIRILILASK